MNYFIEFVKTTSASTLTLKEALTLLERRVSEMDQIPAKNSAGRDWVGDQCREAWRAIHGAARTQYTEIVARIEEEALAEVRVNGYSTDSLVGKRILNFKRQELLIARIPEIADVMGGGARVP